ncbi:Phosphotransferase enzyme family protein [Parafrankia irregularis]|uniref:Phosphotransferase enzyme family protein n=1 Tax=Parafrankia irregularis TaxID=795642 RepID=A0A0S4QTM0_9ACTN|nr:MULTISPECIES: phosphotransferase [Parafrankia]MBE3202430.1 phosphotransferase [Parafrankia sp. CH37]CUU58945.1 Phosphotransferase enzyme family protein [Parafrankia irregularis]
MTQLPWSELPRSVRDEVERRVGRVTASHPATGGRSNITTTLHTPHGPVFIKGARERPFVGSLRNEAATNPYVRELAPALLWSFETDGWVMLGFEHVDGHRADFSPGSADLPLLREALTQLEGLPLPPHATARVERHYDHEPAMSGEALVHSDLNRHNVLIAQGRAHIVDWAWACRGAPWVDLAMCAFGLMVAGHTIQAAEDWCRPSRVWTDGPHLDRFTAAHARVWAHAVSVDPSDWKQRAADIAQRWASAHGMAQTSIRSKEVPP